MGFTSFWWTRGLGELNGVYIVLVDTAAEQQKQHKEEPPFVNIIFFYV
jgi:hypothetical protein